MKIHITLIKNKKHIILKRANLTVAIHTTEVELFKKVIGYFT